VAPVPLDAEFLGIQFSLGTFMPGVRLRGLVGKGLVLPPMSEKSFWLDGAEWELPQAHNAGVFVDRLVGAGLLVHDPVVPAALAGETVDGLSTRSVERRVARAITTQRARADCCRCDPLIAHTSCVGLWSALRDLKASPGTRHRRRAAGESTQTADRGAPRQPVPKVDQRPTL
jgi:hypothetical protein